jgi:hypothetical protein
VRCLHVLGYGIGSAIVDTLLPLATGIVAIGMIGFALFLGCERVNARRARFQTSAESSGSSEVDGP